MTAKICADIKPGGIGQRDLIDIIYDLTYALQVLCDKLDPDDGVVTNYASACFDAVFNAVIEDTQGNIVRNVLAETSSIPPTKIIGPLGIEDRFLIDWLYEWTYCFYLIAAKLDGSGGVNDTDYEALTYTVYMTQRITNSKGNSTGVNTTYTFQPGGVMNDDQILHFLYHACEALRVMCAKLDADGTLTDTDYETLCYTNIVTLTVEDTDGLRTGN